MATQRARVADALDLLEWHPCPASAIPAEYAVSLRDAGN